MSKTKKILQEVLRSSWLVAFIVDFVLFPMVLIVSLWIRLIKFIGLKKFVASKFIFSRTGIFPLVDHYYEPRFNFENYEQLNRELGAIDYNHTNQLAVLKSFSYREELKNLPKSRTTENKFFYNNGSFPAGDAECYYSIIREYKPSRIIEIGSGYSTLLAIEAINMNLSENRTFSTELICIEPFEFPWLEELGVKVIREKVENVNLDLFNKLESGDILFIDSTHMIKPQGDVTFEVLQILPKLKSGTLIHFHDIFTPLDYPESWLKQEFRLWNEQYLVEAFLADNDSFDIFLALSFLNITSQSDLLSAFPVLSESETPSSLWLKKK